MDNLVKHSQRYWDVNNRKLACITHKFIDLPFGELRKEGKTLVSREHIYTICRECGYVQGIDADDTEAR